ncbi:MAG: hypothetical protein AB7S74_05505 [Hyphomicrobium sp.]
MSDHGHSIRGTQNRRITAHALSAILAVLVVPLIAGCSGNMPTNNDPIPPDQDPYERTGDRIGK